jgi:hypothetical protein
MRCQLLSSAAMRVPSQSPTPLQARARLARLAAHAWTQARQRCLAQCCGSVGGLASLAARQVAVLAAPAA